MWQWQLVLAPGNKELLRRMSLIPAEYMLVPAAAVANPVVESFSQKRRTQHLRRKGFKAAMKMMIVMVCSYLICNLLNLVITFWEHVNPDYLVKHYKFYTFASDCVSLLTIINSSLRLPIYYLFNPRFRQEVKAVLRRLSRGAKSGQPAPETVQKWHLSSSTNNRYLAVVSGLDDEDSCTLIDQTELSNSPHTQENEQNMPNGRLCSESDEDEIRTVHFV